MMLLIAIAVVGGTILFTQTEGLINSSQISSQPSFDLVKIMGYDARDTLEIETFEDTFTTLYSGGIANGVKSVGERIGLHLQNNAVNQLIIKELRLGGNVYQYTEGTGILDTIFTGVSPAPGQYVILESAPNILINSPSPTIEPGQAATLIISLDEQVRVGKDIQVKITSNNGAVFVGTVVIGDYR